MRARRIINTADFLLKQNSNDQYSGARVDYLLLFARFGRRGVCGVRADALVRDRHRRQECRRHCAASNSLETSEKVAVSHFLGGCQVGLEKWGVEPSKVKAYSNISRVPSDMGSWRISSRVT